MNFANELKTFKENSHRLKELVNSNDEVAENKALTTLLDSVQHTLSLETFRFELNEHLYLARNEAECMFLAEIMHTLLNHVDTSLDKRGTLKKSLGIMLSISDLKTNQILPVTGSCLIKLMDIMERVESETDLDRILHIILNLSECSTYETLDYSEVSSTQLIARLDELDGNFSQQNLKLFSLIRAQLNEQSFTSILRNFDRLHETDQNVTNLIQEASFFKNIRFLSLTLTKNNNRYYYSSLFSRYNSYAIFSKILGHFICTLRNVYQNDDMDLDEVLYRPFRDLLDIIFQIGEIPLMKYNDSFLRQGVLKMIVQLFSDYLLVDFLFDGYLNIIFKLIRVFFRMSINIFYSSSPPGEYEHGIDDKQALEVLIRTRNKVETLEENEEGSGMQEKIIYHAALAYLQEKFKTDMELLETRHFEIIMQFEYVQSIFKKVSRDFVGTSELVYWEFFNEHGKREVQKVSRITFGASQIVTKYYQKVSSVDLLNLVLVFLNTDDKIRMGYNSYKHFFYGIIFFGLDIERVLCVKCLINFKAVSDVNESLRGDVNLNAFLKSLLVQYENHRPSFSVNANRQRLIVMIEKYFETA